MSVVFPHGMEAAVTIFQGHLVGPPCWFKKKFVVE